MKDKVNFDDMLNPIDKIKNITNVNDAQFEINLYCDQLYEIDD